MEFPLLKRRSRVIALCVVAITALGLALALAACGGEDSQGSAGASQTAGGSHEGAEESGRTAMSKAEIAAIPKLAVAPARGPAPEELVVRDVWKGTGAELPKSGTILVNFLSAHYREPNDSEQILRNYKREYSLDEVVDSWKEGLPGMRVGGRRELIVPDAVNYENGTIVYVIDLLAYWQ